MIKILDSNDEEVANEIHQLFQCSYREEARLIQAEMFPPLLRTKEQIRAASTEFLGTWLDSELSAVVEYTYENTHLSIDSLAVAPRHFRRGLASQLLNYLLGALEWRTAEVETACANEPAIALYRRLGFAETEKWTTGEGIEKIRLVTAKAP